MKILLLHNNYLKAGGEDVAFNNDEELYNSLGYHVETLNFSYEKYKLNQFNKIRLAITAPYNRIIDKKLFDKINQLDIDLFHIHNYFPFFSPVIIKKILKMDKPVLMTIHNFRLFCINGIFLRKNSLCTKCYDNNSYLYGIIHKCYKNNLIGSISVSLFMKLFKQKNIINNKNMFFLSLSKFAKKLLLSDGSLDHEKIFYRPNFIIGESENGSHENNHALIVSRLSEEKGVFELIELWMDSMIDYNVKILGDGPLFEAIQLKSKFSKNIEVCGYKNSIEVKNYMDKARFLIFTTKTYENCPFTLLEAFASGLPVIAPSFGSIEELILDNINGLKYDIEDRESLLKCIDQLINMDEKEYKLLTQKTYDYYNNNFSLEIQKNNSN